MKTSHRLATMALLMSISSGCDQATKRIATDELKFAPAQSHLGDLFRIQYAENPGAFLGVGAALPDELRHWLLIVGVGALLIGMLAFALLHSRMNLLMVIGSALFLGGGFSNWADRLLRGNVVVDFMNVGVGPVRSGVFNVADLLIEAGVVLVLVGAWRLNDGRRLPGNAGNGADRLRRDPVQANRAGE